MSGNHGGVLVLNQVTKTAVAVFLFFRFLPLEAEITVFVRSANNDLESGSHLIEGFDEMVLVFEENIDVENVRVVERFALIRGQFKLLNDDLASIVDTRCLEAARLAVGSAERYRDWTQF